MHYTQAELDRNYDQRTWDPESAKYIQRYPIEAAAARKALANRTFSYGSNPDETLDVFYSQHRSPTVVFVHGGAWRNFDKSDFSYIATQFVRAGYHFVIVNFSKLPGVRLPEVVDQIRRAVVWVDKNRAQFRGGEGRLYLCGHSSGAHLSAVVLTTDWSECGSPSNPIGGAALISGSYDLQPALLSKRGAYISVTAEETRDLSPMFRADQIGCRVLVAYAEKDTDEFRRQSEQFACALHRHRKLYGKVVIAGLGHFAILDDLCRPGSDLLQNIVRHASKTTGADDRHDNAP